MTTYWLSATSNAFSTTLNGSIGSGDTSITLNSVTGLQAPGVLVIDRQDGSGNNTPTVREYISYTGISTNTLTGVTRGRASSTAQAHSSGALVEEVMTIDHWNDARTLFLVDHTLTGAHNIANATIVTSLYASGASVVMSDLTVQRYLNVSGASLVGSFPLNPTWVAIGSFSGATTGIGRPLVMPQGGSWAYFCAVTPWVASGASVVLDVKNKGASIFSAGTLPCIPGGGTFISTASINTKAFSMGDILTIDLNAMAAGAGLITDITIQGRGY